MVYDALGMSLFIRQRQFDALAPLVVEALVTTVDSYLLDHHPECVEGLSYDERRERIRFGIAQARHHGLTRERSIANFVHRTLAAWPDFEKDSLVAEVLAAVSRDPNPDARYVLFDVDLARLKENS